MNEQEYQFFKKVVIDCNDMVDQMEREMVITKTEKLAVFQELIRRKLQ